MLVAVAGLAGVGKTTAIQHFASKGIGRQIYVGRFIRDEVMRRGLAPGHDSEASVRDDMRKTLGRDVFARKVVGELEERPNESVLLDAIYVMEEAECYRQLLGNRLWILGLDAKFERRADRLSQRQDRPFSRQELERRDEHDRRLGVDEVLANADVQLRNNDTISEFIQALDGIRGPWSL